MYMLKAEGCYTSSLEGNGMDMLRGYASSLKGGGGHPDYFVKLDFEIAVDQQTSDRDQTFEGVPDSGCPPVPAGHPRPYWVNLWPNFAKLP